MGGPFSDLEGTDASMLVFGLRGSISVYKVSHRSSASRRSCRERPGRMKQGDEAYEEPRLRGFALESWSYNYDVTRTLPKSGGHVFLPSRARNHGGLDEDVALPCQNIL